MHPALFICYNYPPDSIAGASRPARFARYLDEAGYEAHVVTCTGSQGPGIPGVVHQVSDPEPRLFKSAWRFHKDLTRAGWLRPAVLEGVRIIREQGAEVVFSTSPNLVSHFVALECKRKTGVKWVADFRDPLLGNPMHTQIGQRLLDAPVEKLLFANADILIANTDTVASMWKARYPKYSHKVVTIWNGYDPSEEVMVCVLSRAQRKVMAHIGDLYPLRQPLPILEALASLTEKGLIAEDALRVCCVGAGAIDTGNADAAQAYADRGLVRFSPRVSRQQSLDLISAADYLLLLDVNSPSTSLQIPSKIFDYARTGKPILTVTKRNSPLDAILQKAELPNVSVYWDDPLEARERAILELLELNCHAPRWSDWFEQNFDGRKQTLTLGRIFDDLTGNVPEVAMTGAAQPSLKMR
jgi:glycosyltransferase involved in cell wall biosynthesis